MKTCKKCHRDLMNLNEKTLGMCEYCQKHDNTCMKCGMRKLRTTEEGEKGMCDDCKRLGK